jgi:hypothetical protein
MPKTKLHNSFDDFTPPASTDGSYLGTQKQVKATQEYLDKKFIKNFEEAKARLKSAKTRVGITINAGTIQLQATLPLKPGDIDTKGTGTKQYRISLGIPANLDGLKTAEEEASELGKLIARHQFTWTEKYLGKLSQKVNDKPKTLGEILEDFKTEYFKTHKITEKSKHTFSYYVKNLQRYIGEDTLLAQREIGIKLQQLPNDAARYNAVKSLKVLKSTLKLSDYSFDGIKNPQPSTGDRRIPTDEEIVEHYSKFEEYSQNRSRTIKKDSIDSWQMWRWVYGMIATYGLRPRELFVNPDINWWLNPTNVDNTWKVDKDTKTGYRETLPLHPNWVALFDLKNPRYLEMLKKQTQGKTSWQEIDVTRINNSAWFRRVGIPFDPYDLRHAWAIRAHLMGIPIKAAADNLGHSVEIHTQIYQRWFGLDNRKKAIKSAVDKKDELQELKEEVASLKAENEALKLKLLEYQVNSVVKRS